MSEKSGYSEEKEDFWGNKYTQNYDSDGNKTGWSEEKESFWGNTYTQNHDEDNNKTGYSEQKESFLGNNYQQDYDNKGDKTGWNEEKESFLGNEYTQNYNQQNEKTGWSEEREGFWGKKYTQHYGDRTSSGNSSSASSNSSYSSSGSSATGYSSSGYSNSGTSTNVGEVLKNTLRALGIGILLYAVIGVGGCITRIAVKGTPPNPLSQTQAHDAWFSSVLKSWTTEAIIIPLLIVALTFFISLIKTRQANPVLTIILFLSGLVGVIYVGSGLINFIRTDTAATPVINDSSQTRTVGTMREVNTINLNMRSGAGANYSVVATFPKKSRIVSYGETRNVNGELWTQASTPDGKTRGWVNRKFLSP